MSFGPLSGAVLKACEALGYSKPQQFVMDCIRRRLLELGRIGRTEPAPEGGAR